MKFTTKKVSIPVKNQKMDGTLYIPDSEKSATPLFPSVLIFHGRGSSQARYTDRAAALAEAGFLTLIFNFRGCGESDGKFSEQTIEMGHEDALAGYDFLLKQKGVDRKRIGVWGGSYGGYQASLLTGSRKIGSLILAVPALYKDEWWEVVPESLGEEVTQAYRDGDDFSKNKALKALAGYKGPLLLVQHQLDEICPKKQTDAVFDGAESASPKKMIIVEGLSHRLVEKDDRDESNKTTVEWFKKTL